MIVSFSSSLTVLILSTKVSRNLGESNQNENVPLFLKDFLGFDILFEVGEGGSLFPIIFP